MSIDMVDELHHAEDRIGVLEALLDRVVTYTVDCPGAPLPSDLLEDLQWAAASEHHRLEEALDPDADEDL